jgi:uncharacterized protein (DUF305 family)
MIIRTSASVSGALIALLLLAGCSGGMSGMNGDDDSDASSSSSAEFNDADVTFARDMIAHHEQAIEMVDILLDKDGVDAQVAALAQGISDTQQPEIDTMTSWLDDWGQDDMSGMDHGDGMMSEDDMASLQDAAGPAASTLFLEQMIEHHQGAIEMATDEVDAGENPDAIALAQSIIDVQTAEISTMQGLLGAQ